MVLERLLNSILLLKSTHPGYKERVNTLEEFIKSNLVDKKQIIQIKRKWKWKYDRKKLFTFLNIFKIFLNLFCLTSIIRMIPIFISPDYFSNNVISYL